MSRISYKSLDSNFAFYLHEGCRKFHSDHSTKPIIVQVREDEDFIKVMKRRELKGRNLPSYVNKVDGVYEVDITKATFFQLPYQVQSEYFNIAAQIQKNDLVESEFVDENYAGIDFMPCYDVWKKMYKAKTKFAQNFDHAVKMNRLYSSQNQNIVTYYDDYAFYSILDNDDTAYLKVYGVTEEEFNKKLKNEND